MDLFDVLAVVGAVTGSVAASAEVFSVWRDRPRLVVNFGTTTSVDGPPRLWLTVLNDGRQPITMREAGFYGSEMPIEINSQDHGLMTGTATYSFPMIREPVLLDPGRMHKELATVLDSVEYGYHVDFPLRTYATDARGRQIWGDAAPIVRMLVGSGPCPEGFPAHQWEPMTEPLPPACVAPKWKLWVRRELRQGNPGRPSAVELQALTRCPGGSPPAQD